MMTWFTYLTGLLIFAIGAACKFLLQIAEWQALLPIAFGLGYMTLAEGMRSQVKQRKLFQFLAILWSFVVLVSMIPLAKEGYDVWKNQTVPQQGLPMRSEVVMEHAGVMGISACYFVVAVVLFLRQSPVTKKSAPPSDPRQDR